MKNSSSHRARLVALPLAALFCLFLCPADARAVPVVGLTDTNRLVFFDSEAPGAVVALVSVNGLRPGEQALAADFRPRTGQLYLLGSTSRLYVVNPVTGAAAQVGANPFAPALDGVDFGFDFDPAADLIRVVSDRGQSLRLDPSTGATVAVGARLTYAAGEPDAGMTPDAAGAAYTNNFKGAQATTLYAIDWRRGRLLRVGSEGGAPSPPDAGQVFTVGPLGTGFQITEMVGFDIAPNTGTAYAALRSGDALLGSHFFTVNLSTGAATQRGLIGGGEFIRGIAVIDRAVDLFAVTLSNKLLRFNSGAPGNIISSVNVTNFQSPGEQIIGLDYLGDTRLYFLTGASRLYYLSDPATGVAQPVGRLIEHPLSGTDFGLTTTPQGYAQAVSDADQNLLVNPYSPPGSSPRTPLAYAAGDPHAGQNPNVVGAAFTHEAPSAARMFDIDSGLDILARQGAAGGDPLAHQSGQLFTVGPLGVDTTGAVGFDIETSPLLFPCNPAALRTGAPFASLTAPGDASSRLYSIDLKTGAATLQGTIGGGEVVRGLTTVPTVGLFAFGQISFHADESDGGVQIGVTRSGDVDVAASVDYETTDGTALQAQDYTIAFGRLHFAPGETTKVVRIMITDDGRAGEGSEFSGENFHLRLSNPTAGFALATTPGLEYLGPGVVEIRILDDEGEEHDAANPIDNAEFFVRQHYRDFFGREPDAAGLAFWTNEITGCGADAGCVARKRINVSAAFFLSGEFQGTGFLAYRLYRASFNRPPRYREFMRDTQQLGRGVVVGEEGWEARLEANKQALLNEWVNCEDFKEAHDARTNAAYVDALFANAGVTPGASERQALVAGLNSHAETRASVLLRVAESEQFRRQEFNRAFVLAEYFGYLRRNPDDPPDNNLSGYNFWLGKLDQFGGDYRAAEMVKAFITSGEYRRRFHPR